MSASSLFRRHFSKLLLILAALAFGRLALRAVVPGVTDPDVFWIAAAGRDMIATGHVPRTNQYSFTEPRKPWVMHEWIFGPPFALGLDTWGPRFFSVLALLSALLGTLLLVGFCGRQTRDWRLGVALGIFVLLCFPVRIATPRPANMCLSLPLAMAALAFGRRFGWGRAAAAIALELFWANAHGSFPLGVVILLVGALSFAEDRARRWWSVFAASLVTLLNPYGWRLYALVWGYAFGSKGIFHQIYANVLEFSPIWKAPHFVAWYEYLGLAIILTLTGAALRVRSLRARAVLGAALVVAALCHVRHWELAGWLGAALVAPALDRWARENVTRDSMRTSFLVAMIVPGLAIAAVAPKSSYPIGKWLGGRSFVDLTRTLPAKARVYVPFVQSGLLIWYRPHPDVRLFYDLRNDCYSAEVAKTFFAIDGGWYSDAQVSRAFDRYGVEFAIVPKGHPVMDALGHGGGWKIRASEGRWFLLARGQADLRRSPPKMNTKSAATSAETEISAPQTKLPGR